MKKLFSLKQDQLLSAISPSVHFSKNGLWSSADGINPVLNGFNATNETMQNAGLLQTSSAPIDISSTIVDKIIAGAPRVTGDTGGRLYMLGDVGHFYENDLNTDVAPTDRRSASPITNPSNGITIFTPKAGTEYLYYWQFTKIGRWDLTAGTGGFTDNYIGPSGTVNDSTIVSTAYHPTHQFAGNVYYGNKYNIGAILDNGSGGITHSGNVLDFPADFITIDLDDDGTYLVAGITKNITSRTLQADTRIIFWDTFSPSWNREWALPDYSLTAIRRYKGGFIAVCGRGIWYFDFNTKPVKIRSLDSLHVPAYGSPQAVDILNDAVLWGGTANVNAFGKLLPEDKDVYRVPWAGTTASNPVSFIDSSARHGRLYAATASKLFLYESFTGGGTGYTAKTVYIPLDDEYQITRIDFKLGEPLSSGDALTVTVQGDEDTSAQAWRVVSFAIDGAKKHIKTTGSIVTDQLKLILEFTTGNVKIKQIDVYGEIHNQQ